jgi:decaprenylphospho-beta-D-erythro-pentofuranosid-2-ulose 2-reductase
MSDSFRRQRVAIFGAASGIAVAVGRRLAERGATLVLVGRGAAELQAIAADLKVRGAADVAVIGADFAEVADLPALSAAAFRLHDGLDIAIIAYGTLPRQDSQTLDGTMIEAALTVNFVSPAMLSECLAERFEAQQGGTLCAITSVAGDRGRRSNYLYGSAKGGLQLFLGGLRHRLFAVGVNVLDVRPGFVSTPMTQHLTRSGPLWAEPDAVARDIVDAIDRRRAVLYTPRFWQLIMLIVRSLPRVVFHRTRL